MDQRDIDEIYLGSEFVFVHFDAGCGYVRVG